MNSADRRQHWKEIEEENKKAREEEQQETDNGRAVRDLKASKGSPTDLPGLPALAGNKNKSYRDDFIQTSMDMRAYVDDEISTDTGEESCPASDDDVDSNCSNSDVLHYDDHPDDIYDALITHIQSQA